MGEIPTSSPLRVVIIQCYGDKRRHDLDNSCKLVLDCLNKIIYEDDSQIIELHVQKKYEKDSFFTDITIYEI
jgi:Holliday junction resolvase RusA-like endonuclease